MIIKRRTKPLLLHKLDAIIPRLTPHFPKLPELQQEAANRYKGFIGEQKVDYHMDQLAHKYTILLDVTLQVDGKTCQFDTIVITKHAIYLIETKNYTESITFNTVLKQCTQYDGTREVGRRYPITQTETQQTKLQSWLHQHNFHDIPIHFFIAIADPGTIIKVIGDEYAIAEVVGHGEDIPKKLMEKDKQIAQKGRAIPTPQKIGTSILQGNRIVDYDLSDRYRIKGGDIASGVHCPHCEKLGMQRIQRRWQCEKCGYRSQHAHKRALQDYLSIFKPSITNSDCMEWLGVDRGTASRLLKGSGLLYDKKHRVWRKS